MMVEPKVRRFASGCLAPGAAEDNITRVSKEYFEKSHAFDRTAVFASATDVEVVREARMVESYLIRMSISHY
jgi:hypothetical protein